jgi:hypothetical protein
MPSHRKSWTETLRAALVSGSFASLASAVALSAAGRRELCDPFAPLNGPSQWVWGRHAPYQNRFSVRHTVVGYAVHHLSALLWATCFERARSPRHPVRAAIATSSVACFVDYCCTPERFTPGFEKRLSRWALFSTYVAVAAGLAASTVLTSRRERT